MKKIFVLFLTLTFTTIHANNPPQPHPKYRNIIFDLAGVLITCDHKKNIEHVRNLGNNIPTDLEKKLAKMSRTDPWLDYTRGTLSAEGVVQALSKEHFPETWQQKIALKVIHESVGF